MAGRQAWCLFSISLQGLLTRKCSRVTNLSGSNPKFGSLAVDCHVGWRAQKVAKCAQKGNELQAMGSVISGWRPTDLTGMCPLLRIGRYAST